MNVFLIDTGRGDSCKKCFDSFVRWSEGTLPEPCIVSEPEGDIRETTLNRILEQAQGDDALIIADDIRFPGTPSQSQNQEIPGFRPEKLAMPDPEWGDLLGFCMLDPGSGQLHNAGFDLVETDGKRSLQAREQGRAPDVVEPFEYRECFAVTGCCMVVRRRLIAAIPRLPSGGMNRWEEILYAAAAWKEQFTVGVLGVALWHEGVSTKGHADPFYGSDSYAIEKKGWEQHVAPFLPAEKVTIRRIREASLALLEWLSDPDGVVIYGAGTVTEFLLERLDAMGQAPQLELCSGLEEENGNLFAGRTVHYRERVDWSACRKVLITVQGKEREIGAWLARRAPGLPLNTVVVTTHEPDDMRLLYDLGAAP